MPAPLQRSFRSRSARFFAGSRSARCVRWCVRCTVVSNAAQPRVHTRSARCRSELIARTVAEHAQSRSALAAVQAGRRCRGSSAAASRFPHRRQQLAPAHASTPPARQIIFIEGDGRTRTEATGQSPRSCRWVPASWLGRQRGDRSPRGSAIIDRHRQKARESRGGRPGPPLGPRGERPERGAHPSLAAILSAARVATAMIVSRGFTPSGALTGVGPLAWHAASEANVRARLMRGA